MTWRKSGRITPLRGSVIGRIKINQSETHSDEDSPISIPDTEFGELPTSCLCGLPFDKHTQDELDYITEHHRCKRLARNA